MYIINTIYQLNTTIYTDKKPSSKLWCIKKRKENKTILTGLMENLF
jgi:hypothetical protein